MGVRERKEREREHRRISILDAAEGLFFGQGYERTKMVDIAEKTELSKGSLYLYFKTKEELARAIVVRSYDVLIGLMETERNSAQGGRARIEALLRGFMRFYHLHYQHLRLILLLEGYLRDSLADDYAWPQYFDRINRIRDMAAAVLEEGMEDGSVPSGMDPKRLALTVMTAAAGFLHRVVTFSHIMGSSDYAPEEMMDQFFEILMRALEWKESE